MTGPVPLLDPALGRELPGLLEEVGADAWLLYDFQDQNPLAHRLLGLGKTTRRAFAFLPAAGSPILLRHRIEGSAWRSWPWEVRQYAGWKELGGAVETLLSRVSVVAMETSAGNVVPTLDRVPVGVAELVRGCGVRIVSSGDLITAFHSRWTPRGLEFHREAARTIRGIALAAFSRAAEAAHRSEPLTDAALMEWILHRLREEGLTDQEGCIVAGGASTADPHYHPEGSGRPLTAESLVLIDLWGRRPPEGVPADQTWMGYLGSEPPDRIQQIWTAVRDARDRALSFLIERAEQGAIVRGYEVDRVARSELEGRGLASYFVHRLGHSIDTQLHGAGPNLDDLESNDDRRLLPGIGFSVEPGVYISGELGVRSEVNVHWGEAGPEITPDPMQRDLLLFPPR